MTPLRPNILFLAHRVPYPPNRGDRIRSFHFLQYIARHADVYLAYLSDSRISAETNKILGALCKEVAGISLGRYRRLVRGVCSFACGRTVTEGMFQSEALKRIVGDWSQNIRFDAVFAYCSSMAQYLDISGLNVARKMVDLVDVDSQKWFDYAAECHGPRHWLYQAEGKRLRKLEKSLTSMVNTITLVSDAEVELFRSFCDTTSALAIPNGVDIDYFKPRPESTITPHSCVFVGALDYRANIDGVQWFCEEIWPKVRLQHPEAVFTMVGSRPTSAVQRLSKQPGIRLANDVPDVRPYLAEAALVVVPLRIARGIQNKILEAMAMEKAVVASHQALEGIAAIPNTHACLASTVPEWVETINRLFKNDALRNQLCREGHELVNTRYRWGRQYQTLATLLGLPSKTQECQ